MPAEFERQLLEQAVDQRRAVTVQEENHAKRPFLRMTVRKRLSLGPCELPPQRLVSLLGGMNHLRFQAAKLVLHLAENRIRGSGKRRVERGHRLDDALHAAANRVFGAAERLID